MRNIRAKKVEDTMFNGNHPNGINTGAVRGGWELKEPTIGEPYVLLDGPDRWFRTSLVTEIISPTRFKTLNSVYEIEEVN